MGRFSELRKKWVVDRQNGEILGRVSDLEIDFQRSRVTCVVVGRQRHWFWPFGGTEETVIPWHRISVIGQDTLLITTPPDKEEPGLSDRA